MHIYSQVAKRAMNALLATVFLAVPGSAAPFTVTNTDDAGPGSLRMAITSANAAAGADTINFAIPNAGVQTITLATALPNITDSVTINGYSQPGASENTLENGNNAVLLIEIDGSSIVGLASGFVIGDDDVTIQGLIINGFSLHGIITFAVVTNAIIRGNFIGTNAAGTSDVGNTQNGVQLQSSNNRVGGSAPGDRNVISGNDLSGVVLGPSASNNIVAGNYIGTDKTGQLPLANTENGVLIFGSSTTNTVGGLPDGAGNIIAHNDGDGVTVLAPAADNSILRNSIHSNGELGIDLNDDGVTPNDALDADAGANDLSNFPVLTSASTNFSGAIVVGTLAALPSSQYRIEFFASDAADPTGHGEGQRFIGSIDVVTNAAGTVPFTFTSDAKVSASSFISATATDPSGNTSEFSANAEAVFAADADDDDSGDDDDGDFDILPPLLPPPPPFDVPYGPDAAIGDPAVPVDVPVAAAAPVVDQAPHDAKTIPGSEIEEGSTARAPRPNMAPRIEAEEEDVASGCSTTGRVDFSAFVIFVAMFLVFRAWRRQS